jgi:hypothetical protein
MVIAIALAVVFLVPIGMVQGVTNTQYVNTVIGPTHTLRFPEMLTPYRLGLNVLTEFMIGYMLPGRPIAMMLFKTYVSQTSQPASYIRFAIGGTKVY